MHASWVETEEGLALVDAKTGETLAVQKQKREKVKKKDLKKRQIGPSTLNGIPFLGSWIMSKTGDPVWVPERLPVDLRTRYPFHQLTWDFVCSLVATGMTLSKIAQHPGAPPLDILYNWKDHSEESAAQWNQARRARALVSEEIAIDIAHAPAPGKDEAAGVRAKLDAAKWASEVGDRDVYGKSTKLVGDGGQATIIIVQTGIQREGDDAKLVESKPVIDVPSASSPGGQAPQPIPSPPIDVDAGADVEGDSE